MRSVRKIRGSTTQELTFASLLKKVSIDDFESLITDLSNSSNGFLIDPRYVIPIYAAIVRADRQDVLKLILQKKTNILLYKKQDPTANIDADTIVLLGISARDNDVKSIKTIYDHIGKMTHPWQINYYYHSPLACACKYGNLEAVKFMVENLNSGHLRYSVDTQQFPLLELMYEQENPTEQHFEIAKYLLTAKKTPLLLSHAENDSESLAIDFDNNGHRFAVEKNQQKNFGKFNIIGWFIKHKRTDIVPIYLDKISKPAGRPDFHYLISNAELFLSDPEFAFYAKQTLRCCGAEKLHNWRNTINNFEIPSYSKTLVVLTTMFMAVEKAAETYIDMISLQQGYVRIKENDTPQYTTILRVNIETG